MTDRDVIQRLCDEVAAAGIGSMCCITCYGEATTVVIRDQVMVGACSEHLADARAFGR